MDPLNFSSTEVVTGIIIVGALVMTVRSILMFTGEMAPKVQKLDMMLNKIRDGMAEKKKKSSKTSPSSSTLCGRGRESCDYYEQIKEIELTYERESAEKGEKDEAEKRKRIQRKKMGFD